MKTLDLLAISHGYFPRIGGAENQLRAFLPHLRAEGIKTTVLTRRYDSNLPAFQKVDDFPVYRLPATGSKVIASLTFTLSAVWRSLRLRPSLIHAHEFISPATVALLAGWLLKTPIIITPHGGGKTGDVQKMKSKLTGSIRLKALRKRVSKFIVISEEIGEELLSVGVDAEKLIYISNGVDTGKFSAPNANLKLARRTQIGLPADADIAVFTGRFVPLKNLDLLISVWDSYRKINPKAELLLVGSGEEEKKLQAMAGEGVHFMGSTNDVRPFLQAADVFILPSRREGLSVSLLEAMSCGLVPLLSDVGGARQAVTHKENGWIIPPNDGNALLGGLQAMFGDKEMLNQRAQAARQRVVADFSIQLTAKKLSQLYFDLAEGKHL